MSVCEWGGIGGVAEGLVTREILTYRAPLSAALTLALKTLSGGSANLQSFSLVLSFLSLLLSPVTIYIQESFDPI